MKNDTRRRFVLSALKTWDVIVFVLCLALALHSGGYEFRGLASPYYLLWFLASCLAWHLTLVSAQVYRSRRLSHTLQTLEIVFGVSLGTSCVGGLAMLFHVDTMTVSVLVNTWALTIAVTVASRLLLRRVLYTLRGHNRNLRFVILIGSGRRALQIINSFKEPDTGYRAIGYVDDHQDDLLTGVHGLRYIGTVRDLPAALAASVIDEVFVTLPLRSYYDDISRAIIDCGKQGIPVRMPLDFFQSSTSEQYVDSFFEGTSMVSFVRSPVSVGYVIAKRFIDVVVSVLALAMLFPLFLFVAVFIKSNSPGPVFFVQQRVGLNKRPFPLIKFRTMCADSEMMTARLAHLTETGGPIFKIRNDPRVTPAGRFLRKTSIDELPQLINVLLGHMSLVGPRPLPLSDVEGFTVDWQRRRFSVKPGITCLWQISGRSSVSFEQWMELDMLYIDRRSFWLDMQILVLTVPAVLGQRGAY